MAVITLTITVDSIASVIALYNVIQVQRSETGSPYTDAVFITNTAASAPVLTGTETGPFNYLQGTTLLINVDNEGVQTVTFTGANPVSIATVVSTFNDNITGATASNSFGKLQITGNDTGTDGTLNIIGGTSLAILGFTAGDDTNGQDANIPLVAGQSTYSYDDSSGSATYYYRTRYYNSISGASNDYSDWAFGTSDDPQIGDPAGISYTEDEIVGINILLAMLKARLKNDVQKETIDVNGNVTLTDCPIFANDELVWFLRASLSEFNMMPHFTDFTFNMPIVYDRYAYIIIEGAYILAAAAQMLIEAGREFTISDNNISLQPPPLSTVLNNQLSAFISKHVEQLKQIKYSIKPSPVGFGTFRVLANNPNFLRLRHLRQRRII